MKRRAYLIHIVLAALIGAMYTGLTMLVYPVAFNGLQFRISEALTVLPFLYPPAAWGLFVGCALSNLASPFGPIDVIFGSLATLSAGLITARIKNRLLAPLPSIFINAVVIGGVITFTAGGDAGVVLFLTSAAQVGAGQIISCYALGVPLLIVLQKTKVFERYALLKKKDDEGISSWKS